MNALAQACMSIMDDKVSIDMLRGNLIHTTAGVL